MANLGFFVSLLTSQASVLNLEPIKMNESISTSSFQNSEGPKLDEPKNHLFVSCQLFSAFLLIKMMIVLSLSKES